MGTYLLHRGWRQNGDGPTVDTMRLEADTDEAALEAAVSGMRALLMGLPDGGYRDWGVCYELTRYMGSRISHGTITI